MPGARPVSRCLGLRSRALFVLAALLPVATTRASAAPPALQLRVLPEGGGFSVWASTADGPESEAQRQDVLRSLERGLRSEIAIELRLYERTRGLAAILGDRLVWETVLTRVLRRDPIALHYVLEETADRVERPPRIADTVDELLDPFFAVEEARLQPDGVDPARLYVGARYRLSPVQIAGSLRIVALFFDVGSRRSAWTTMELGP